MTMDEKTLENLAAWNDHLRDTVRRYLDGKANSQDLRMALTSWPTKTATEVNLEGARSVIVSQQKLEAGLMENIEKWKTLTDKFEAVAKAAQRLGAEVVKLRKDPAVRIQYGGEGAMIDYGIEIDPEKFTAWSKKLRLADLGAFMQFFCEAVDKRDDKFIRQFDWAGKYIERRR